MGGERYYGACSYLSSFMNRFFSRSNSLALTITMERKQYKDEKGTDLYTQFDRFSISSMNCDADVRPAKSIERLYRKQEGIRAIYGRD